MTFMNYECITAEQIFFLINEFWHTIIFLTKFHFHPKKKTKSITEYFESIKRLWWRYRSNILNMKRHAYSKLFHCYAKKHLTVKSFIWCFSTSQSGPSCQFTDHLYFILGSTKFHKLQCTSLHNFTMCWNVCHVKPY